MHVPTNAAVQQLRGIVSTEPGSAVVVVGIVIIRPFAGGVLG
jgi:hypothetical protein